jgi:hypothetical protein
MLKRKDNNWIVTCDFRPGSNGCNSLLELRTTGNVAAAKAEAKRTGWYVDGHGRWFCPEHPQ